MSCAQTQLATAVENKDPITVFKARGVSQLACSIWANYHRTISMSAASLRLKIAWTRLLGDCLPRLQVGIMTRACWSIGAFYQKRKAAKTSFLIDGLKLYLTFTGV